MFRNQLYYQLKPLMPRGLRLALRRRLALQQLRQTGLRWPIDPQAAVAPPGWTGWPDSKRFALVLTHDVERVEGLARSRSLMEMERRAGFRSLFNFVPEGEYQNDPAFRSELVSNGFEVGVHDLKHDGKLYRSRPSFRAKARRINFYLQDWGAVGFRSGFMMRRLDWLHELNLRYDSSTFDTDPFEPEPEGVATIFPFWIARGQASTPGEDSSGYVELPYTLAQDSTLFAVLREPSIEIWKLKLEWIAQNGGMALLNTHPDYMDFGSAGGAHTYPATFYQEFLAHVRTRYAGQYWSALPREVADWVRQRSLARFEVGALFRGSLAL